MIYFLSLGIIIPVQSLTSTATMTTGSNPLTKFPRGPTSNASSSSTLKSQDLAAASNQPASGAATPTIQQSDSGKAGGRHPHPPSANNTKLKHKVRCSAVQCSAL